MGDEPLVSAMSHPVTLFPIDLAAKEWSAARDAAIKGPISPECMGSIS